VLLEHPAVDAVVVVGVPDDEWGERVVAVVARLDSAAAPELAELRAFAAMRLEPAAVPRLVVPVERMPMLASGKPDRSAVRSLVAAYLAR
jgi:o-succinylbenzoate---CoA ligase